MLLQAAAKEFLQGRQRKAVGKNNNIVGRFSKGPPNETGENKEAVWAVRLLDGGENVAELDQHWSLQYTWPALGHQPIYCVVIDTHDAAPQCNHLRVGVRA